MTRRSLRLSSAEIGGDSVGLFPVLGACEKGPEAGQRRSVVDWTAGQAIWLLHAAPNSHFQCSELMRKPHFCRSAHSTNHRAKAGCLILGLCKPSKMLKEVALCTLNKDPAVLKA